MSITFKSPNLITYLVIGTGSETKTETNKVSYSLRLCKKLNLINMYFKNLSEEAKDFNQLKHKVLST